MLEYLFVQTHVVTRLRCGPMGPYLDNLATRLHQQGSLNFSQCVEDQNGPSTSQTHPA